MRLFYLLIALSLIAGSELSAAAHVFVSLDGGPTYISRIDGNTGQRLNSFPTINNAQTLALSPGDKQALVMSSLDDSVALVDLATGTVGPTITLTGSPVAAFFSANGATAFIIGFDITGSVYTLHLLAIDPASGAVLRDVAFPALYGPDSVQYDGVGPPTYTVSSDGTRLYLVTQSVSTLTSAIAVFDLPSLSLQELVPFGAQSNIYAQSMTSTRDGKYLIVSYVNASNPNAPLFYLALVSIATYQPVQTVAVNGQVQDIFTSPDGASAYLPVYIYDTPAEYLETVSLPSLENTNSLMVTDDSNVSLAISPDGTRLLIGGMIVNPVNDTVEVQKITSLSAYAHGQFTQGNNLWVVEEYSAPIAVLGQGSSTVSEFIPAGQSANGIAPGQPGVVYAIDGENLLSINVTTGKTFITPLGFLPYFVATAAGKVFVEGNRHLIAYDPTTGRQMNIPMPQLQEGETNILQMYASPTGKQLFVEFYSTGFVSGSLGVFDTSTYAETASYVINPDGAAAVNGTGTTLYAIVTTGASDNTIEAIDLTGASGPSFFPIPKVGVFTDLCISPDGSTLYGFANQGSVFVINAQDGSVRTTYPTTVGSADTMAITPDGTELYLTDTRSNQLTTIDTSSGAQTQIDLGTPSTFVTISNW